MAHKLFQADADQLMVIAQMFTEQAQVAEEVLNELNKHMSELEGGAWVGHSADVFYAKMHEEIFTGLKKLAAYMDQSSETAKATAAKIEEGISHIFSKTKTYGS